MAQPVYDPSEQIRRTGQEVASNIDQTVNTIANRRLDRMRQAEAKISEAAAIKAELGRLGADYVKEDIDALTKEMRDTIYKETKRSGNYTIDTAAVGSFEGKLAELRNLAENTKALDQTYAEINDFINKNKGYFLNEAEFKNDFMRNWTTKEFLTKNPQELQAALYEKAMTHLNYEKMILEDLDFGTRTVGYQSADGQASTTKAPEFLVRQGGKWVAKEDIVALAVDDKMRQLNIPEEAVSAEQRELIKQDVIEAAIAKADATYTFKEGDPDFEEKREAELNYRKSRAAKAEADAEKARAGIGKETFINDGYRLMVNDIFRKDPLHVVRSERAGSIIRELAQKEDPEAEIEFDGKGMISNVTYKGNSYNLDDEQEVTDLINTLVTVAEDKSNAQDARDRIASYLNEFYPEKASKSKDNSVPSSKKGEKPKFN